MNYLRLRPVGLLILFVIFSMLVTPPAATQSSTAPPQSKTPTATEQKDTAGGTRFSSVDEVAKRVDSLQFIVVYNAELLRRDLDAKVIWIYVMLGVMIVASMMMYGMLNQSQRQRKELEEKLLSHLSSSVADLEAKISQVASSLSPSKPAAGKKKPK